jgi:hypothetical protein
MARPSWLWVSVFGLVALAGIVSREWALLHQPDAWGRFFSGPGEFPPQAVVTAFVHGQSVAAAYAQLGPSPYPQPYPLPYLLAFIPVGLLGDPLLRPAVILLCACLFIASLTLLGGGLRNPGIWPVLISVPLLDSLLTSHLPSAVGLTGLCLAAWAQPRRRWVLLGVGMAIGLIRPPNALPLLAVLVYSSWGEWRGLIKAAAAGACVLLPLVLLAFWLDPGWVSVYRDNLGTTVYAGLPLVVLDLGGTWALILLQAATILGALYLVRSRRGQPLDSDLAAYAISLGVLSSKLSGVYSGIYALPALARLGLRPQLSWTPWIASGAAWLLELSFLPGMLAGAPGPPGWEAVIAYWFVFAAWPLAVSRADIGRIERKAPAGHAC